MENFDSPQARDLCEALLARAKVAGATFCEIFIEKRNTLRFLVENGVLTGVSPAQSMGAGIRVWKDKDDVYVSTNLVSESGLTRALADALNILGLVLPPFANPLKTITLGKLRDYSLDKRVWEQQLPDAKTSAEALIRANQLVSAEAKHVQSAATSHARDHQEVLIAASDGTFVRDIRLTQTVGTNLLCVQGSHRSSVSERGGSTSNPSFLLEYPFAAAAQQLSESAQKMLYADYVDAGVYPVVMANHFGGVIFHEACGHLLETTQLERKTSPFSESMNQKIAHSAVTAIDEGLSPHAFGTISVDDEGMEPQKTILIENGFLKNFLADRGGELKTGYSRTGSARRQDYTYAAASRMRNTFIAAGTHTKQDLFDSVERGIYCKRMGGGSVGATGQFNFAVDEAYLIENGKLTRPLKGATLIGEAKDVLQKISMCANDLELAPGFCGSVSGSIYVTVGQPHIRVDTITVGGR